MKTVREVEGREEGGAGVGGKGMRERDREDDGERGAVTRGAGEVK